MSLSSMVTVNITTLARGVSQAGFGTPLVCGYHTAWADYVREYNDLAELVADGIPATSAIYKAATAIMSAEPNPPTFKVGRRNLPPSQTVSITPVTAGTGFVHTVTVNSVSNVDTIVSYTQLTADAVADIVTALQSGLDAVAGMSATDDTTHVTCAADAAGDLYFYNSMSSSLHLQDNTTDPGLATDIAAIRNEDDDWYGFCLDSNSEAEIKAAQAVIETLNKIAAYNTADWGVADSGTSDDVATDMAALTYDRCLMIYSSDHDGYAGASWLGTMLPTAPGSATWSYKSLKGTAVDSTLSTTQLSTIAGKNCNYYTPVKGFNLTFDGSTPGGSYADITRGRDWLEARLEEGIVTLLANNPKVPFTDAGVGMVKNQVWGPIREGQNAGLLAFDPEPTVTAPPVASVSTANKAARTLPDVNFTATLQGAIHTVAITGVVSV